MTDEIDKIAHNTGRGTAPKVPTNWQEKYYDVKDGLKKAINLLKQATCENCGFALADEPSRSVCGDASHVIAAHVITEIERLLE